MSEDDLIAALVLTPIAAGSMSGLAPTAGPGRVVASPGNETVEFEIV